MVLIRKYTLHLMAMVLLIIPTTISAQSNISADSLAVQAKNSF